MNIRNGLAVGIVGVLGLVGTAAAQTYTRVETITYKDDLSAWILGQVERTTASGVVAGRVYAEREVSRTEFTARMQPYRTFSYGNPAPDQTFDYHPDGTVSSVRDGRGNATTLNSWKRGIPQYIRYADGTGQSATVNDDGTIANVTDEAGNRTCYQYDAMGRLSRITYPSKITPGRATRRNGIKRPTRSPRSRPRSTGFRPVTGNRSSAPEMPARSCISMPCGAQSSRRRMTRRR